MFRFNQLNSKQFILSYQSNHRPQTTLLRKTAQFSDFILIPFTPSMYKNILLADKLHIFSHINLFCFIKLNSRQFIFFLPKQPRPHTTTRPPDFWILFLILNSKYVHVFKLGILFSTLNPMHESLCQTHQTNGVTT